MFCSMPTYLKGKIRFLQSHDSIVIVPGCKTCSAELLAEPAKNMSFADRSFSRLDLICLHLCTAAAVVHDSNFEP